MLLARINTINKLFTTSGQINNNNNNNTTNNNDDNNNNNNGIHLYRVALSVLKHCCP